MTARYLELIFTPSVKAAQTQRGSRNAYAKRDSAGAPDRLGDDEAHFISTRDSVYLASVGSGGWPYAQHRGGPVGFIKVLSESSIGFADYSGNRQYVSVGNLADDSRVALFMMDYPRQARLKLLGRARVVDLAASHDVAAALIDPEAKARVERGIVIDVEAFDWNCSQFITPRYTEADLAPVFAKLMARIADLEAQVAEQSAPSSPTAKPT